MFKYKKKKYNASWTILDLLLWRVGMQKWDVWISGKKVHWGGKIKKVTWKACAATYTPAKGKFFTIFPIRTTLWHFAACEKCSDDISVKNKTQSQPVDSTRLADSQHGIGLNEVCFLGYCTYSGNHASLTRAIFLSKTDFFESKIKWNSGSKKNSTQPKTPVRPFKSYTIHNAWL